MKPFNLEEAKAGKPVCTSDGYPVRIICFDRAADTGVPIVGLVKIDDNVETIIAYDNKGRARSLRYEDINYDLMMAPEKKEGWMVIYTDKAKSVDGCVAYTTNIYETEEQVKGIIDSSKIKRIVKVEWEE